jgi:hypothetical protein
VYRTVDHEGEQVNLDDADVWITRDDGSNNLEQIRWLNRESTDRQPHQPYQRRKIQEIWPKTRHRLYASSSTELTKSMPRPSAVEIDGVIFMMY